MAAPPNGKDSFEFSCHFIQRQFARPFSGNDDDIVGRGELTAMAPEKFSQEPLDPVSRDRFTYPRANRDAQSVDTLLIDSTEDNKMGCMDLLSGS